MPNAMESDDVRLTSLCHGGGCGCKIAPALLEELLGAVAGQKTEPALLVGTDTRDDAAVYKINERQAVVATTDFFMPIVDDPFDFGRISATNALSDVYAMGGRPILALGIVGMPVDKLPAAVIAKIIAGGRAACEDAGVVIGGGHSIDAPEPIYGLAAVGLVEVDLIKRNDAAKPGDALILGKPLGIGILSAALKKGVLDRPGLDELVGTATQLNAIGIELASIGAVHAMTDVTGFGLLGHLLEMCSGAALGATVRWDQVPVLSSARALAEDGITTGAAGRNWAGYGGSVRMRDDVAPWQRNLLCDPQTSGGLLVACEQDAADQLVDVFHTRGFLDAAVVGVIEEGPAEITVR
jgi:selenide,water dikinase